MDQSQIGKFIAELRKENNMTQAELGDRLGVTNKTVSRWENGNYMPDISLIKEMCQLFHISVNDFISRKRIEETDFRESADQNLLTTLSDLKYLKKQKKIFDFLSGSGTGLLLSSYYSPESTRRVAIMLIALTMIGLSWFFKSRADKRIMGIFSTS